MVGSAGTNAYANRPHARAERRVMGSFPGMIRGSLPVHGSLSMEMGLLCTQYCELLMDVLREATADGVDGLLNNKQPQPYRVYA